jgi:hypothetical protein
VLSPLLDCGDWFMKPYSFVLDAGHLYYDKAKQIVSYVYVPSLHESSDPDSLRDMAIELSNLVSITDPALENKVLRALMRDFSPAGFLKMIKPYSAANYVPQVPRRAPETAAASAGSAGASAARSRERNGQGHGQGFAQCADQNPCTADSWPSDLEAASTKAASARVASSRTHDVDGLDPSERSVYRADWGDAVGSGGIGDDESEGFFFNRPTAGDAPRKPFWMDFLGGKKDKDKGSSKGRDRESSKGKESAASGGVSEWFARRDELFEADLEETSNPRHEAAEERIAPPLAAPPPEMKDETENVVFDTGCAHLRYIGSASLPGLISVRVSQGEAFTIGRFDASVGRQQSSFEFDKKTKGVSRRHAAIECRDGIYCIIDLASSAGTFVDGQKLPPNTACYLQHGSRVSFGNSGANYVWEE